MPAKDLGRKHVCFKCGAKFYDLGKPIPLCPKCGADQRESPSLRSGSTPAEKKRARTPAPAETEEIPAPELEEDLEEAAEEEAGGIPEDE
jgi:uncharacterized protein (TIGR02300 family)